MPDRGKINMAIAKLQAAGDIALATGCELAKIPALDALEIADLLERLTAETGGSAWNKPKRESRAMLPCKCGCVRREHWFGVDMEALVCKRCGFEVVGKNNADAIRKWNKAVSGDD